MQRTAETQRAWTGAALWSRGFRPFFLGAAVWAALAVAIWPWVWTGRATIPTAFSAVDWHVHEMIFGYGAAVVAGFLLTAVPNWTGRLPVAGRPLAALSALWLTGRLAVFTSAWTGAAAAALVDAAFLAVFFAVVLREVIAAKNGRNVKVAILVGLLALANIGFHVEAIRTGTATYATRSGLAGLAFLVLLIGGRVVPSFTHTWLARLGRTARPVPFGRADGVVMGVSATALVGWIGVPENAVAGLVLLAAGIVNLWRLSRWQGAATWSDRLVFVLHVGFFFAALGFVAAGLHALRPDLVSAAIAVHVWAIGAIGVMTLAMMTRATLGHSGQRLAATPLTQFAYAAVVVALAARLGMELLPAIMLPCLFVAAGAWVAGFAAFLIGYGSLLLRPPTA